MSRPKATVFIVHDDPPVRHALRTLLESDTRQVISHGSPHHFLANFEPTHPSCLIMDLHLPRVNGLTLLEQLRDRRIDLPVIALTARPDIPAVVHAVRLGVAEVLEQPVELKVVLLTVGQLLTADADRCRQLQRVAASRRLLASLTPREHEMFTQLIEGKSYKEIAATLTISPRTVEHHRAHIAKKLGITRRVDMVRLSLEIGQTAHG